MLLFELANQNQISITGLFELNEPKGKILVIKIALGSGDKTMHHDWDIPVVLRHFN